MKTRRDFLTDCGKALGTAALAPLLLPVLQSCAPTSLPLSPETSTGSQVGPDGRVAISVSDLTDGNPVKIVSNVFGPDGLPVLVSRLSATDYRAMSSRCTHAGCEVSSSLQSGDIPCLCHGSLFGLDGSVKQGPATTPLQQYDATYDAAAQVLHVKVA